MWLKDYLSFGPKRAAWTYFADEIFALKLPKGTMKSVNPEMRISPVLQSWEPARSKLGDELKSLLETMKKFGVRMEGIVFPKEAMRGMPIWFHKEADEKIRRLNNSEASRCLLEKHGVRTVGDAEMEAKLQITPGHRDRRNCACNGCKRTKRETNCRHPNECAKRATELLDQLPEKWDPRLEQPADYEITPEDDEDWTTFDHVVSVEGSTAECFRIFMEGETHNERPDTRRVPVPTETIRIAIAGECIRPRDDDAQARAGIYVEEKGEMTLFSLPEYVEQSREAAEMVAIMEITRSQD
ncbi:hypothetical protein C8F01DRAFT_922420, partial [Mycena amicta]